jgi:hypothetical protein
MTAPVVSPEERFRSGINTLRAVLVIDILFDLLYVLAPGLEDPLGQIGNGIALLVALVLLAVLRDAGRWRWVLGGWVAMDVATVGAAAWLRGGVGLWLFFTAIVAAYVYWACTTGERGRGGGPAEPPGAADHGPGG